MLTLVTFPRASATIDAAAFSGANTELGSIELGKWADMILLGANPLTDIRNTRKINGLFSNGRFLDYAALEQLLAFAEQQAGSAHTNVHLLWAALNSPIARAQFSD